MHFIRLQTERGPLTQTYTPVRKSMKVNLCFLNFKLKWFDLKLQSKGVFILNFTFIFSFTMVTKPLVFLYFVLQYDLI